MRGAQRKPSEEWSNQAGFVDITWQLAGPTFTFRWAERGGPPVKPPSRRSFGSRLIENLMPAALAGRAAASFSPTGFVLELEAPLRHLQTIRLSILRQSRKEQRRALGFVAVHTLVRRRTSPLREEIAGNIRPIGLVSAALANSISHTYHYQKAVVGDDKSWRNLWLALNKEWLRMTPSGQVAKPITSLWGSALASRRNGSQRVRLPVSKVWR
jgi:hypothetical protein